jgi:ArsR family metal-binding transcriptional regulator
MAKKKEKTIKEKTIVSQKTHTFIITEYSDGTVGMYRENDGFTAIELLGYTAHIQLDIQKRFAEFSEPDIVEKKVVKPKN